MLFREALEHVPDNAVVVEIAPHSLLQAVLRRALAGTCTVVGLMDKRQPDNLVHLLTSLGKCVHRHMCSNTLSSLVHSVHSTGRLMFHLVLLICLRGSVAEWLACWTQAQKGPGLNRSRDTVW